MNLLINRYRVCSSCLYVECLRGVGDTICYECCTIGDNAYHEFARYFPWRYCLSCNRISMLGKKGLCSECIVYYMKSGRCINYNLEVVS